MRTFNSLMVATATATLALCAAQAASAQTVVNLGSLAVPSFTTFGNALNDGNPDHDSSNTFIWEFQTTQSSRGIFNEVLSNTGSEDMQFELDKCTSVGMGCTPIATSNLTTGPTIPTGGGTFKLGAGDYQLETLVLDHPAGEPGNLAGSINLLSAVPEPSTWAMLILGVGLIGFAARRRREGMAAAA